MWNIGIHNGYWLGSGYDDEFSALKATKQAGADYYEVNTGTILRFSDRQLESFRNLAEDLGLKLSVNGGFSAATDIGSDNPSVRRKGLETAEQILHGMQILHAKSWSGIIYGAWKRVPKPSSRFSAEEKLRIKEITVNELKKIGAMAQDSGVTILFEIVNRYEQFLLNTASEGRSLISDIDIPVFKLLLDTYHMNIEEDSIVDAIRETATAGLLGEIHLGESNRRLPGLTKSHMHWDEIFEAVREVSYDGLLTLEPFMVQGLPISSRICVWRDLSNCASSEQFIENAEKSISFVRSFEKR